MAETQLTYKFTVTDSTNRTYTVPVDFTEDTKVEVEVNGVDASYFEVSKGMYYIRTPLNVGDEVAIYLLPASAGLDKTISSISQNGDVMTISYNTGETQDITLPKVDPISITSIVVDANSQLVITLSDNSVVTTSPIDNTYVAQLPIIKYTGELAIGVLGVELGYIPYDMTITGLYATCKYNPVDADVVFSVYVNDVLQEAVTLTDGYNVTTHTFTSPLLLSSGDVIKTAITQVGSTFAGSDLSITLTGL